MLLRVTTVTQRPPVTPAVRALRAAGVAYEPYLYDYEQFPGAVGAAAYIGIDPGLTAKTIVLATSEDSGVVVLMNGDREISTKAVARFLGVKQTRPATQREADRWTGYQFGGTSPLGLRTSLPILAQQEVADLDTVYVNAGSRGFVVGMDAKTLIDLCNATVVDVSA